MRRRRHNQAISKDPLICHPTFPSLRFLAILWLFTASLFGAVDSPNI